MRDPGEEYCRLGEWPSDFSGIWGNWRIGGLADTHQSALLFHPQRPQNLIGGKRDRGFPPMAKREIPRWRLSRVNHHPDYGHNLTTVGSRRESNALSNREGLEKVEYPLSSSPFVFRRDSDSGGAIGAPTHSFLLAPTPRSQLRPNVRMQRSIVSGGPHNRRNAGGSGATYLSSSRPLRTSA